jgi:CHRD domain
MKRFSLAPFAWIAVLVLAGALPAAAQIDFSGTATADLSGFNEVPSVFSFGGGRFEATVNEDGTSITWDLTYDHLTAPVTQSHIHFAEPHVNGAIVIFFCSNLTSPAPPAGTPACPPPPAHLTGTFTAANVGAGAAPQGIGAQQIRALLRAMRSGATYVNVHSTKFPGGEIRGQVRFVPTP